MKQINVGISVVVQELKKREITHAKGLVAHFGRAKQTNERLSRNA